jgi:hypothetical protein
MYKTHYIPRQDGKFLEWVRNLLNYVKLNAYRWNITTIAEDFKKFQTLEEDFESAYARAIDPNRGKADVLLKNETRDALEKCTRKFVKEHLTFNSLVSDVDREKMDLPIHKTTLTPAPVAKDVPYSEVDINVLRRLTIHFFASAEKKSKAKPEGQHGVEFAWIVSEVPITNVKDLIHSSFGTHSPKTFEFDDEDRAKRFYFALRWENTRGEKGPYSEIASAIIP